MSSTRDAFLNRVRQAVKEGNRPGEGELLPPRGGTGYQGAGADPVGLFHEQLTVAGGFLHRADNVSQAVDKVLSLIKEKSPRRVLLGRGTVLEKLSLRELLTTLGVEIHDAPASSRDESFQADLGISGVSYLIAETGSVVVQASEEEPRSLTLLPPIHIAIADESQLLPDLFDLFDKVPPGSDLPSCLTLITGPSKTGDIELKLVTGVHGPGELHIILFRN